MFGVGGRVHRIMLIPFDSTTDAEGFRCKPAAEDASRRGSVGQTRERSSSGDAKRLQPQAYTGTLQRPPNYGGVIFAPVAPTISKLVI